jgi:hypothetical protein
MRTVSAETTAWLLTSSGPECLKLDPAEIVDRLAFSSMNMATHGWTKVGAATIAVSIEDEQQIVENKIESLKAEKNSILAEAQMKATKIDGQIQNLLAIEYKGE